MELTGKFESTNLSRENLSREIGRTSTRTSRPRTRNLEFVRFDSSEF